MTHTDREAQYVKETGKEMPSICCGGEGYDEWLQGFCLWLSQQLERAEEMVWHKYPDEVPTNINNKWVTVKDGTTDISWYNSKSRAENLHWDGFLDEDIIAWAEIKYPNGFIN